MNSGSDYKFTALDVHLTYGVFWEFKAWYVMYISTAVHFHCWTFPLLYISTAVTYTIFQE